jgi:hypothetical protein
MENTPDLGKYGLEVRFGRRVVGCRESTAQVIEVVRGEWRGVSLDEDGTVRWLANIRGPGVFNGISTQLRL